MPPIHEPPETERDIIERWKRASRRRRDAARGRQRRRAATEVDPTP